ncbi:3-deoxy-manno-octulosonate cytidylyltransferase [Aquicoccus sp. G2-2]|uniref:3-deoxy-manno-octulosonate cytidylyltransferase n=1 Tax=Aquicoccus sp. G2-2 TaxID=3092120 RepID=UPI002AE044FA|nr:3-deoxy-manno-octulosonate cytidylyltransferase [Aquicoccus sp. G2-2]MEA1114071.1 3-deoxy-manno-octulosonate cytidylyltransferase [Aquicoccus sp. G2-2]
MAGKTIALIPARMESSRLPNKPLRLISGLPMIVHVAKRAALTPGIDQVAVCTDSIEILMTCERFGIAVCMTKASHRNGTERIAEAAETMGLSPEDIIIDVQGDEPFVRPEYIEQVAAFTRANPFGCVVPHQFMDELGNLNRVKIVEHDNRVIYFSRADVPLYFGALQQPLKKHLSIIGFRLPALQRFAANPPTPLEEAERIELMRLIELGEPIGTFLQDGTSLSVDTPEDYELACRMMEHDPLFLEKIDKEAMR